MSLFKYLHPDAINYSFKESGFSLRLSQPAALNDPFEIRHKPFSGINEAFENTPIENSLLAATQGDIELTKSEIIEFYKKAEKTRNEAYSYIMNIYNRSTEAITEKRYGIISLSSNKQSRPMWSYYSKNNSGFLVEFSSKEIEKDVIDFPNYMSFINKLVQEANRSHIKKRAMNMKKTMILKSIGDLDFMEVNYNSVRPENLNGNISKFDLLIKDEAWSHELEWRCILPLSLEKSNTYDNNGFPIKEIIIPHEYIKNITLGLNSSQSMKRRIQHWIDNFSPATKLYQTTLNTSQYHFDYMLIK
ncbi:MULTISPECIES: DUF2971 domain-containing protein [Marinomonas]|uniref:DUF2971 domain-containing protein n=1 Tax=Marinomonas arctica TaxID=383750 RepID=A0A7H1J7Y5_9GAMM|nr:MULTISPECIES: DUF2971 domain-containing protein [Marinomonas]MCS7486750.1 hypothetical protein [Marinomonas sp. BSi20414]QNT06601.1 DUF2971 domain-containing protein [Marinomonas arctica]GGN22163.1 hypothetical protein GCM10011350_09720 [Marinomonas arctica]